MRITSKMIAYNILENIELNVERLGRLQDMISSGKRIKRPSDDPVAATRIASMRSTLTRLEQYKRNLDDGISWLQFSDSVLGNLTDLIARIKELVVRGANGGLPQESMNAIAEELKQIRKEIISLGNSSYMGRFIFAGFKSNEKPFSEDGSYLGDSGVIRWGMSPGIEVDLGIPGDRIFSPVISVLDSAIEDVEKGRTEELADERVGELEGALDLVLRVRADIGARTNRLEYIKQKMENDVINIQDLLSKEEDVDMAEIIMKFQLQDNVYRAALAAGARAIIPSLVDFLK
jgi:flagellar hook-associated protein 3 FlgL